MNKTYPSAVDALRDILKDGQKLAVGGFGLCGIQGRAQRLSLQR